MFPLSDPINQSVVEVPSKVEAEEAEEAEEGEIIGTIDQDLY